MAAGVGADAIASRVCQAEYSADDMLPDDNYVGAEMEQSNVLKGSKK